MAARGDDAFAADVDVIPVITLERRLDNRVVVDTPRRALWKVTQNVGARWRDVARAFMRVQNLREESRFLVS